MGKIRPPREIAQLQGEHANSTLHQRSPLTPKHWSCEQLHYLLHLTAGEREITTRRGRREQERGKEGSGKWELGNGKEGGQK